MSPIQSHIDELDFESFLEKLKAGNDRSWYQLDFVLKRIICKWLNQKSIPVDDSIEIYNAVFSIFYEKIQETKFETFKNLKSYIFAIAENKLKEYYRYRVNRRKNESIDNEPYSKYIVAIVKSAQTESQERLSQVEKCYGPLTQKERRIINLVYKEGISLKKVAEMLAISESNARVIKHRALAKIRKRLSETGK